MNRFFAPGVVHFGPDALGDLTKFCEGMGVESALLVSDQNLCKLGLVAKVEAALGDVCQGVFVDVPVDGSPGAVEGGVAVGEARGAEIVISLGGGSVMDCAKGIALVLGTEIPFLQQLGIDGLKGKPLPHLAIPTTCGTGSEVSPVALIRESGLGKKLLIHGESLLPAAVFLDPGFLETLPPKLVAATALDALTHALESWLSLWANPFGDALATESCQLILHHLPSYLENGPNTADLSGMQIAATLAGQAFCSTSVGLLHAISHTIGGRHSVHHGELNTVLLLPVLRFLLLECEPRLDKLARRLGFGAHAKTPQIAIDRFFNKLEEIIASANLAPNLSKLGVDPKAIPNIARETLLEPCILTSPKAVENPEEIENLLQKLF